MTTRSMFQRGALGALLSGLLIVAAAPVADAQERGQDRPPPAPAPKDRGQKQGEQRGQKDTPPKPGGQRGTKDTDRPKPKPVRDTPARGGKDDPKPKPVRDTPPKRPTPTRDGPARDKPTDGPGVRTPPVKDGPRDGPKDEPVAEQVPVRFPPLQDVEKKKLHNVERAHRRRLARIEELRAEYTRDKDTEKLAELDRSVVRQTNLYKGKIAQYEKDFGADQIKRAIADLPERKPTTGVPPKKTRDDGTRDTERPKPGPAGRGRGGR